MRIIYLLMLIFPLSLFSQNRYAVVIDEIMADPTPPVGLPGNEWIELKNRSALPINLQGWRVTDASGQSGPMPSFVLLPDSFVVVCATSAFGALSSFGTTISVTNFPSLDNAGDQLALKTASGRTVHAVEYDDSWYQNELKKEGGWTLEMMDPGNPCAAATNWKASVHAAGGTPGHRNSVDGIVDDRDGPNLTRTWTVDSITIVAVFDEPVDSLTAASHSNYAIDGGLMVTVATPLPPLFNQVELKLSAQMQATTVYQLAVANLRDCAGNPVGINTAKAGLPVAVSLQELVVNEILFDPKPGDYDFVELFNPGKKIFDVSKLYIANRNSSGVVSSITLLSKTPLLFFPGDYLVATENKNTLQQNYLVKNPGWVIPLASLPSFPDDEGDVVLLNAQGVIIDEVKYNDDWQFKLIDNPEGVSLERIDPMGESQAASNWHSAASTAGYATPTSRNSQYKQAGLVSASIEISPKVFSPDNDGHDDVATISYKVDQPGWVCNVIIFDSEGRQVRHLVKNGNLGVSGSWNWDGLNEQGEKLALGIYIIFTEIFNLQGKTQHFKNAIVLARPLQ